MPIISNAYWADRYPFQAPALCIERSLDSGMNSIDLQRLLYKFRSLIPCAAPAHDQVAYAFTLYYASASVRQSPKDALRTFNEALRCSDLFSRTSLPGAVGVSYLVLEGKITHAMFATSTPSPTSKRKRLRWRQQRIDQACMALGSPWISRMPDNCDDGKCAPLGNCQEELSLLGLFDAVQALKSTSESESELKSQAMLYVYTETTANTADPKGACWKCQHILQNAAIRYGIPILDMGDGCRIYESA